MTLFPSSYAQETLCKNDFLRFAFPFTRTLKSKIPTATSIAFVSENLKSLDAYRTSALGEGLGKFFVQARHNLDTVVIHQNGFLLPFSIEAEIIVAVVTGVDSFVVEKMDPDWLLEIRNSAVQEFTRLKQRRIDWDTGLLNAANLHDLLQSVGDFEGVSLMLIELYPKARSSREAIASARKGAFSLINYSDNRFFVHYLGHGLFALVASDARSMSRVGTILLSWLRKESFARVHIGYSYKEQSEFDETGGQALYKEAWQALQEAGKRGPFSYCDFSLLAHPEQHPLRRPPRKVMAKLSRRWKDASRFSLVHIQCDLSLVNEFVSVLGKSHTTICDGEDVYIFLEEMDSGQAQEWIQHRLTGVKRKILKDRQFFIGIATYPCIDFSKSEVLHNCRKAVVHASFYGSGGVAIFDALSLNISGDVFYQEGDLKNAVREYKKGLICDENNVNLLNSLGVAYAMMEKHRPAHQCFLKVLNIDPENFMALYNLGLGEKYMGMKESAIKRFEKALIVHHGDDDASDITKDIQFQLGKLYCETKEFQKSVDILLPWYEDGKGIKKAGYACHFLGKSFHGLQNYVDAMVWLQRALQFDGFDAEVMGLLGEVYLEQGEGDDIALTLCLKSVEIDPNDLCLKLRLAKVQTACGKYIDAQNTLRPCLKRKKTKAEAELQNGLICRLEGKSKKASSWFSRVLLREEASISLVEKARYYLEAEKNGYEK